MLLTLVVLDCRRQGFSDILRRCLTGDWALDVPSCQGGRRIWGVTDNTPPLLFYTL